MEHSGAVVAVVGATGVVGQEMLRVLVQRKFPVKQLRALASPASAGKVVSEGHLKATVQALTPEAFDGVRFALFSAGADIAHQWAPIAAARGAIVIDNSSAFRNDPQVPLCVPEVNAAALADRPKGIIANPNCSTIQLVVALKPIHDAARIRRIVVSTYQAVSGAGARAVHALQAQERALLTGAAVETASLKGQLAGNLLMHWKVDAVSGYQ